MIDDDVAFDDDDDDDVAFDDDLILHAPRSNHISNGMHHRPPLRSHASKRKTATRNYGFPWQDYDDDYDEFKHVDHEIEIGQELDDDPLESNAGSKGLLMHTRPLAAECQSPSYQPSIKDSEDSLQLLSLLHVSSTATANACNGFENVYEDVPLVEADDAAEPARDMKSEWLDVGEQQYLSVADGSNCADDSDLEDGDGWLLVS
jgi:hypothetical protein